MKTSEIKYLFSKSGMLIFIVGLFLAFFLFFIIKNINEEAQEQEFLNILQRESSLIQRELDLNIEVLHSLKSLYESSNYVSRKDFKQFVQTPLKQHKSIQALEWIPKVTHDKRALYEEMASIDLKHVYTFKELSNENKMLIASKKALYYPVYYVEPLEGNEAVLGLDFSSIDIRLNALLKATTTRTMEVSSKIKLVQSDEKDLGFFVLNPVMLKQNNRELQGFVLGIYRIKDIVNNAFLHTKEQEIKLHRWLVDITQSRISPEILYSNTSKEINITNTQYKTIQVQNRTWRLYAQPTEKFGNAYVHYLPYIMFVIVIFITGLFNHIMALRLSREENLHQLVAQKTKDIELGNRRYASLLKMFDKKVIASKTDLKGKITYVTQAFCDISGYSRDELIGYNHNIVRHPDMSQAFYEKFWQTLINQEIFTGELKNRKKDGSAYWVNVQVEPEYDNEQNVIGYFAIREDITAKKQLEELNHTLEERIEKAVEQNSQKDKLLLEQSKLAAMGEMIGAIAHQWRQPLNTLAMKIQFLEDDYEDELLDEKYLREFSNESMQLIHFMSKTIDDFRNFFILDKKKIQFDILEKIQETTSILEPQLKTHKINLMITGESFMVLGYPNEFQQVVLNIVNNAKDAMIENHTKEGMIHISLDTTTHTMIIKDNAGGIPQDILPRIFEPYFTTKEQGKGTGLGLYMSKMIIEDNMHGKLQVYNESGGAKFIIQLGETHEP